MNIAVFGATGGTGRQIIAQALEQGHHVTALVRDPARLPVSHTNLTVVQGDVLDDAPVLEALQGADAAVITLGNTADNPDYVVSNGTAVILRAMKDQGVPRVVVVTSLGVGDSLKQVSLPFRMMMQTVLKKPMEDKERQERMVMDSGLEWIIVRPGGLTDGPATGVYRSGLDPAISAGQVSRADVAAFVLQQLSDDTYLHRTPAIS
jgi:putative NADH-flavin reductase